MPIALTSADLDFSKATPVISGAMKFILPVPADRGEALVYPETVTDAKGTTHQKGETITTWDGKPIPGDGIVVFNSSEGIYQAAVRGRTADERSVIIINHVTEGQAALLTDTLNDLTGGKPDQLTFHQFKQLEAKARHLGLTNMYDSNVAFVKKNMQDIYTGQPPATPYGFMKRDARDRVLALRADFQGELIRPDQQPLPFAAGSIILKHGDDLRVITPADIEATYKAADDFSPIDASKIQPLLTAGGMVVDPTLTHEIATRAAALNVADQPDSPVHHLGSIRHSANTAVPVHLRHAVDAVVMDRRGNVLLIERAHNPGAGKLALPGGFIDPAKHGTAEDVARATLRELAEETGLILPAHIRAVSLGKRQSFRPFDVRQAFRAMPDVAIEKGDYFAVTTKAFAFLVEDITILKPTAGDDARKIAIKPIDTLVPNQIGIEDHLTFIKSAASALSLRHAGVENTQRLVVNTEQRPGLVRRALRALRLVKT